MSKAAREAKAKRSIAYLRAHGHDRTTGNCPLCHNPISNGTMHAPAACKPRRRVNSTVKPLFHVKQG